jgi:hypothetical protein
MTKLVPALLAGCFLFVSGLTAQDVHTPPEHQALFAAVRENLARAQREQRFFAYKERRSELRTNPFGRLGTGPARVYDVTPLPDGGFTRRLLERDGKPVANAEVEESRPRNRGARPQGRSALDDAISVLDIKLDRREREGDRSIAVLTFSPRADAKPERREGRLARSFKGVVRVDDALREVIRIDATAIDDIAYGYGLIARLDKGTQVSLVRREVEPGLWLPVSLRLQGQGHAMIFRKLNLDYTVEWSDYRRVRPSALR